MGTDLVVAQPIFHSERTAYVYAVSFYTRQGPLEMPEAMAWKNATLENPQPPLDFDAAEFARDSAGIVQFERLDL